MRILYHLFVSAAVAALVLVGLMYWYKWSARALTEAEVDSYMATIEAQTQFPGGRHNIPSLRRFLEEDDGRPFYTINRYKFRRRADYPSGSGFSGTGTDAYARFASIMTRLLFTRGSHPIYGSDWVDPSSDWDRIVIVRYRSRRDIADLFASDAFADASLHKWASIQSHDRMLVQALDIPSGEHLIYLISIIAGLLAYVAQIGRAKRRAGPE